MSNTTMSKNTPLLRAKEMLDKKLIEIFERFPNEYISLEAAQKEPMYQAMIETLLAYSKEEVLNMLEVIFMLDKSFKMEDRTSITKYVNDYFDLYDTNATAKITKQ
jgi:hypothetical protein